MGRSFQREVDHGIPSRRAANFGYIGDRLLVDSKFRYRESTRPIHLDTNGLDNVTQLLCVDGHRMRETTDTRCGIRCDRHGVGGGAAIR